jgi:microtubule-associated protein-like 5
MIVSLSRLQEFYGSFQSVCDNFSIDLTEFEQIFGANESSFIIWDTDNNGLIDALELFAGLAIFSESEFYQKISFLFYLFDFNGVGSLNLTDIEFMLDCCMSSIFKVYEIKNDNNDPVYMTTGLGDFVMDNFSENISIDFEMVSFRIINLFSC